MLQKAVSEIILHMFWGDICLVFHCTKDDMEIWGFFGP